MQMKIYMKLKLYATFFIALSVFFFSCKSAEKLYQKGNYDEAVELAAKKLSKKPNDASLLDILQNAYRFAVEDHQARIQNYSYSTNDLRWEQIYNEYNDLQRLYNAIRKSPSVFDVVQPTDYSSYITTYKEEAANARIDRGLSLMDNNTKNSYKDAYYEFQKALELKPGDIDIRRRMDEAYAGAVTNVVLLPLNRYGYQYTSYNFDQNNFDYNVLRYLTSNNNNRFTQYYTATEARGANIRIDNSVEMRYSDVNVGRYRDQRSVREVSRQIVSKETVYSKDSVVKEYITVKAKITTTTRTVQADGLLQATARDHTERLIWSDTYRGNYNWSATFATFTGDERALSDEDKKLLNQREQWPPSNDEIIRIIMNDLQNKTECGISTYFNRIN
jgi:tetratricopeptide (TPR) repeat protein